MTKSSIGSMAPRRPSAGSLAIDGAHGRTCKPQMPARAIAAGLCAHSRRPACSPARSLTLERDREYQPAGAGRVSRVLGAVGRRARAQRGQPGRSFRRAAARPEETVRIAERRQPAEGAAGEMVSDPAAAHSARRADARASTSARGRRCFLRSRKRRRRGPRCSAQARTTSN